jgi:uncharacterized protein YdiU (UPF0061 family)
MKAMKKNITWNLQNTYASLPNCLYHLQKPSAVSQPKGLLWNGILANQLGLTSNLEAPEDWELYFSGNKLPEGASPLAQAYAGHQFGYFNRLGDGRALLLSEQVTADGTRFDLQLKGSGPTPYSRRGDGRATLRSMLREYLISEAMFSLGIPTTRSLAVVGTGDAVRREQVHPGAVLTRVATSHIRVGTFEFIHQFEDKEVLKQFFEYTAKRHESQSLADEQPVLSFFDRVMDKQIALIVHWMRVGFIHGVMNTDNMSISGETIDYGPCAFMNRYNPKTVFSSIDENGRYAFSQQAPIAHWNLMCLAETLLPLLHENLEIAVEMITPVLNTFPKRFETAWKTMMAHKIGLQEGDTAQALVTELLQWMHTHKADYTHTFLQLMYPLNIKDLIYVEPSFVNWREKWKKCVTEQNGGMEAAFQLMQSHNPCYIPRNALVEQALDDFHYRNDRSLFDRIAKILQQPYQLQDEAHFMMDSPDDESNYKTFCGT